MKIRQGRNKREVGNDRSTKAKEAESHVKDWRKKNRFA